MQTAGKHLARFVERSFSAVYLTCLFINQLLNKRFTLAMDDIRREEMKLLLQQFTAGLEHARQKAAFEASVASDTTPPVPEIDWDTSLKSDQSIDVQLTAMQQKLVALLKRN